MSASMFQMGFRAGGFRPLPVQLGISLNDIKEDWQKIWGQAKDIRDVAKSSVNTPATPLPAPVPVAQSTIMGVPTSSFMIGSAVVLGVGVLAAVLLSQKKAS